MPLTPAQKRELVNEYQNFLSNSAGFYVFEYRGLNVEQFNNLRNKIRDAGGSCVVVKNRMLKIAG